VHSRIQQRWRAWSAGGGGSGRAGGEERPAAEGSESSAGGDSSRIAEAAAARRRRQGREAAAKWAGAAGPTTILDPPQPPLTSPHPTPNQVATLRSAVKLEQEQQFLIAKKLQELTGSKNIKLKPVIDTSLIAGFVVEYGSSQIDLSIRGQVERVAENLTKQMTLAV
jgi:hypothetical protein